MNKNEMLKQKKLEAKMREMQIANKRRREQESGNVASQWGKATSPSKLIDNGHYMKSDKLAAYHYKLEQNRNAKKSDAKKVVLIKKV
jgi:hypothetical protein